MNEYVVEKIIGKQKKSENEFEYLVKWENYPLWQSTWEPMKHLQKVTHLIAEFEEKQKQKEIRRMNRKQNRREKTRRERLLEEYTSSYYSDDSESQSGSYRRRRRKHSSSSDYDIREDLYEDEVRRKSRPSRRKDLEDFISEDSFIAESKKKRIKNQINDIKKSINEVIRHKPKHSRKETNRNELLKLNSRFDIEEEKEMELFVMDENLVLEKILDARMHNDRLFFLVVWKDRKTGSSHKPQYVSNAIIKRKSPKELCNYYESKINFVYAEKKKQ